MKTASEIIKPFPICSGIPVLDKRDSYFYIEEENLSEEIMEAHVTHASTIAKLDTGKGRKDVVAEKIVTDEHTIFIIERGNNLSVLVFESSKEAI